MEAPVELDAFDRKILTLLQKDSRMPQRDIGEAVHLSASAVNRRIAAMEAAGVITAYQAIVDPAKVGRPITIIVEVTRRERAARPARCGQAPAARLPGSAAALLRHRRGRPGASSCSVADMAEYERLTRQLFFAESNVKSFRTMVAMERSKVSLAVDVG